MRRSGSTYGLNMLKSKVIILLALTFVYISLFTVELVYFSVTIVFLYPKL